MSKPSANDLKQLRTFISPRVEFSEEEIEAAGELFRMRSLEKGEFFAEVGGTCQEIGFVLDGALRAFYQIADKEITLHLLLSNSVAAAMASFVTGRPSAEGIQALLPSRILYIDRDSLDRLFQRFPQWERLGRKLTEESFLRLEKRLLELMTLNAEERYHRLFEEQPELLRLVPLQHIASLLGINPETLSRIRRRLNS